MNVNLRSKIIALVTLAIIAFATPLLMAQSLVSGDISGTVTDPTGAVVPGATVVIKSVDTGTTQTATTNASGVYRFSLLRPGAYALTVSRSGFTKFQRKVTVALGTVTTADVALTVGGSNETVEVRGDSDLINTENANATTSFSNFDVSTLPNPGGDLTNIALTAPGVTLSTSGGYGNFTANGLPATANVFTVNGENAMDPFFNIANTGATNLALGLNEIQEASVVTNPYSGEYGQQAGAQVNYITKAGTNAYHGSATYSWNGRAMNANDWFANNTGAPRPFANDNQWGAEFGGPIQKDKTFFYVNNEGLRLLMPTSQLTYLPTTDFANASLAYIAANQPNSLAAYQKLYQTWLAAPGAANAIAAGSGPSNCSGIFADNGDGTYTNQLAGYGFADNASCLQYFTSTASQKSTEWILSTRIDHNFSDNDRVYGRYRMDRGLQATYTSPINSALNAISRQPSYDGQLQWTHIFGGGKATNEFKMSGQWYSAGFQMADTSGYDLMPVIPYDYGAGFTTPAENYAFPQGRNVTQYQFIDDYSQVHGNHTLKFGVNFRRYDVTDSNLGSLSHPRALFTDMLQLATGEAYVYQQRLSQATSVPIAMYGLGIYGQDEWRVNNHLKLTLALRAEHNSNPVCQTDCFQRFNTPFEDQTLGPDVPYNSRIITGLHQAYAGTDAINWSPRVGFSWSPFGDDKTVFSGGIGLFYDAFSQGIMENAFMTMPFQNRMSVYNSLWLDPTEAGAAYAAQASSDAINQGFANGATYNSLRAATGNIFSAPGFTTFNGTMHTPQFQEWNLMLQRQITNTTSVSLNYVGSHGIHIPISNSNLNAYDAYAYVGAGFPLTKPDKSFGTVAEYSTIGLSNSNGLTAALTHRMSHGFEFQANYTWSHALDEISNGGAFMYGADSVAYGTTGQMNPTCLRCNNYGNADYDIRHNFSATLVWQTPSGFSSPFLKHAIGGWTFSSTIFAHSGLPYTVLDGNAVLANGGTVLAQQIAPITQSCSTPKSPCFDPASFVDSGAADFTGYASYPSQRRNQYRGPGFFDADLNMKKSFKLTERFGMSVGANFFNVFNHPNFMNPNWYLSDGDSTVGNIQSSAAVPASLYGSFMGAAAAPRLVQLQARITF
jgi:hypothetical protein